MCERREARPGRDRKSFPQRRDPRDDVAIVPGVGDDEDDPGKSEIPLLEADPALECLDVIDARLGLDQRGELRRVDHSVGAATVSLDRHRDLRPHPDDRGYPTSKSFEQCYVSLIAYRISCRVKGHVEFESENGSHLGGQLDGELVRLSALGAPDLRV
jgi:hypothetical protein